MAGSARGSKQPVVVPRAHRHRARTAPLVHHHDDTPSALDDFGGDLAPPVGGFGTLARKARRELAAAVVEVELHPDRQRGTRTAPVEALLSRRGSL